MPFDRETEYRKQLAHSIAMAKDPAFKAHAWAQAKDLDAGKSGLFRGLAADLTEGMRNTELKDGQ